MIPLAASWDCRFCGLVVPWAHRFRVPWDRGFASHVQVVVFQFPDNEKTPMAMEKKSDTVMPTYRNPGSLNIAGSAEAGTDVPTQLTCRRGFCGCRWNWRKEGRGGGVGGPNDVVSGAANGERNPEG